MSFEGKILLLQMIQDHVDPYLFCRVVTNFFAFNVFRVGYLLDIPQTSFLDQSFRKRKYKQPNNHGYQEK